MNRFDVSENDFKSIANSKETVEFPTSETAKSQLISELNQVNDPTIVHIGSSRVGSNKVTKSDLKPSLDSSLVNHFDDIFVYPLHFSNSKDLVEIMKLTYVGIVITPPTRMGIKDLEASIDHFTLSSGFDEFSIA